MRADLLDVVAVVSNPVRWDSRIRLAKEFIEHMIDSGVRLTVVDCAHGERPHEFLGDSRFRHVPVRARTLAWNKESLGNIGLSRLPDDWKYVAMIDADIQFQDRKNWAANTVHALQQYHVVQPWSDCYDQGPNGEHVEIHRSFCRQWAEGKKIVQGPNCGPSTGYLFSHPGFAWAYTRQALEWTGGLIETACAGAGDHHMAMGLIGRIMETVPGNLLPAYSKPLLHWQKHAQHINMNIGFVPGTIVHRHHGPKKARQYVSRWDILARHDFDPYTDLKRNLYGVIELAGNKPYLARALDQYYRSRREDQNSVD